MEEKQSWSVIIFCYNEHKTVGTVILDAIRVLSEMSSHFQVIAVNDGSTDGSGDAMDALALEHKEVHVIHHPINKGIGSALRSGYEYACNDNVVAIAADGEFHMDELRPFANLSQNSLVSFYREVNTVYSSYRDMLSLINRKVNKLFLGMELRDVNWSNIYKTSELKSLDLRLTSSLIESEICAKLIKKGCKVIEAPSQYLERKEGKSKGGSFKIVWQAAKDTYKLIRVLKST